MNDLINTLLTYNCKLTMYDFNQEPVIFCLAVYIDDPKDIWHIANLCRDHNLDMGRSPQYDEMFKFLYFPHLILDKISYDHLTANA
jgi:hypothetical protein